MKQSFFYKLFFLFLFGSIDVANSKALDIKPFQLIQLQHKETVIYLKDYFLEVNKIVKIEVLDGSEFKNTKSSKVFRVEWKKGMDSCIVYHSQDATRMGLLNIRLKNGETLNIPLKKSTKRKRIFTFADSKQSLKSVKIKGTFNNWNASSLSLKFEKGNWIGEADIEDGTHQYVYVINDKTEIRDPNNKDSISNGMGGFNSIIYSKETKLTLNTWGYTDSTVILNAEFGNDTRVIALYNNKIVPFTRLPYKVKSNFLKLIVRCPKDSKKDKLGYVRVWIYSKNGMSDDVLVPLKFGKVLKKEELEDVNDNRKMIIYNPMIDRFYDGNPGNNKNSNTDSVLSKVDFYGGDLEGINEKLNAGYFQELSVNTLWISPVVLNPSAPYGQWLNPRTKFSGYHGYWPISLRTIDTRFGNKKSFESLIHDVHSKKMKILVDYVAHHVHESHALYRSNPEWFTSLYLADGSKNTERWDDYRLTTWFDDFMPTFNFFKPDVVNAMTDTALWWFKSYQIDGFRHDATKHIPNEFWRSLTFKLKKEMLSDSGRSVFQIGETYGSAELIGSYLGNGLLDAQFDFNVYDGAVNLFKSADGNGLEMAMILNESKRWYGSHHFMGNITGNQDRPRFISLADGSLKAGENYKQAGWDRDIQILENNGYLKLQNLLSLMIVIPGVPVVYYGDEIGLPGAGDPDSRRMMVFDKEKLTEEQIFHFKQFQKLLKLRSENIALVYGDCQVESKTKKELIIKRSYFDEQVVFIHLNYTDTSEIQNISANYSEMELLFDNWVIDKTGKTVTRIYATKK